MEINNGIIELCESTSDDIDLIFAGDFCPGGRIRKLLDDRDYVQSFSPLADMMKKKDLSIVNLECPLTKTENPIPKIGPHLKADPSAISLLQYLGFDIVCLANNHIMDHGKPGLEETISVCQHTGIKSVGAGSNLSDALQPLIIDVKTFKVAILNFAENEFSIAQIKTAGANPIDPIKNYRQITDLKNKVDFIFLIIHGGNEEYPLPNPYMVELYRFYADLGVTAIIGHHPHCAGGFEIYHGVPIFYSLGNFIFESPYRQNEDWYWGYYVNLTMGREGISRIILVPYRQLEDPFVVKIMDKEERAGYFLVIKRYSEIITHNESLEQHWKTFCKSRSAYYVKSLLGYNRLQMEFIKRGLFSHILINKNKVARVLNLIRCEAHRAVSVETLKQFHTGDG